VKGGGDEEKKGAREPQRNQKRRRRKTSAVGARSEVKRKPSKIGDQGGKTGRGAA